MLSSIIIATIKSWNIQNSIEFKNKNIDKYNVYVVSTKEELTYEYVSYIKPKYLFFPHWSWIIPKDIYENFNCVVFHMTDLPFGRGGSPLQNLIIRKVYKTKISAIKVCGELDSGDVYLKKSLSIATGNADEIFSRGSKVVFTKMIPVILQKYIKPKPQKGQVVSFKRRVSGESNMLSANLNTEDDFFDFIRMLDGQGYPHAFIQIGNLKVRFSGAKKNTEKVFGKFVIEKS